MGIGSVLPKRTSCVGEIVSKNLVGIPVDFSGDLDLFYAGDSVAGDSSHDSCGSIRDGVFLGRKVSVGFAREFLEEASGLIKCPSRVVRKFSRLVPGRAQCLLEFLIQPVVVFFYADFQLSGDQGRILT